jgi:hypothetical protein
VIGDGDRNRRAAAVDHYAIGGKDSLRATARDFPFGYFLIAEKG